MMAFSVTKLSLQVNLKVKQIKIGQFKIVCYCHFSNFEQVAIIIFKNVGQVIHLLQIKRKQDCFFSLFIKYHLNLKFIE